MLLIKDNPLIVLNPNEMYFNHRIFLINSFIPDFNNGICSFMTYSNGMLYAIFSPSIMISTTANIKTTLNQVIRDSKSASLFSDTDNNPLPSLLSNNLVIQTLKNDEINCNAILTIWSVDNSSQEVKFRNKYTFEGNSSIYNMFIDKTDIYLMTRHSLCVYNIINHELIKKMKIHSDKINKGMSVLSKKIYILEIEDISNHSIFNNKIKEYEIELVLYERKMSQDTLVLDFLSNISQRLKGIEDSLTIMNNRILKIENKLI